jgi:hypothetical protein
MVNGQRTAGAHIISGMALHAPQSRYVVERFLYTFSVSENPGSQFVVIVFSSPVKFF